MPGSSSDTDLDWSKATVKRSGSLRNTARRLSGSLRRSEQLSLVPGRRKGITYATHHPDAEDVYFSTPVLVDSNRHLDDPELPLTGSMADLGIGAPVVSASKQNQIPEELKNGLNMMRITHKKRRLRMFRIDPQTYELSWDSKTSSRCSIDSIMDIREGEEAKYYRESLKVSSSLSDRWATILYHYQKDNRSKPRLLHVVAQSMGDFRLFLGTLKRLAVYRQAISRVPGLPQEALLEDWTKYASSTAVPAEQYVTIDGVQKILHKFYIYCSRSYLKKKFAEVDTNGSGHLTFPKFEKLVQILKVRPEIHDIFEKVADMEFSKFRGISKAGIMTFCRNVQKMQMDDQGLERMYERFSQREGDVSGVPFEGFSQLLMSDRYMPLTRAPTEDLTHPLTDYFISSSHNTYLVGRQVAGESSIEPYIQVLEDGCRCLEIDCWDGDEGPIVNHGRTFTSSVSFESVIDAINHYAFRASTMPIILSLEVHCNIENQNKMVDIMKDIFGDKLVTEPLTNSFLVVPSPSELKNRILVKVKAGSQDSQKQKAASMVDVMSGSNSLGHGNGGTGTFGGGGEGAAAATPTPVATGTVNAPATVTAVAAAAATTTTTTPTSPPSTTTDSSVSEREEEELQEYGPSVATRSSNNSNIRGTGGSGKGSSPISKAHRKDAAAAAKHKISGKLGVLGVYLQGIKFRNFSLPISKTVNHCFSFSEDKMNAIIKDESANGQLVKHNKKYFLRVYPSGYRLTSTNYDPIPYWKRGAQMVSLNWQTYGKYGVKCF